MQAISLTDLEVRVVLGLGTLKLDVLRNNLVGHIAACCHKEAACPQVPTPELLAQAPKVSHQPIGALALDGLHHSARRQMRRHRKQQMNVIRSYVAFEDVDVVCPADLPDQ